jgi:peptidyl-prolyl cis-trans isomerase SurA
MSNEADVKRPNRQGDADNKRTITMAMMHPSTLFRRCRSLAAAAAIGITMTAAAHAQHAVAMVNGDPITALDVEQRMKLIQLTTQKAANRPEVVQELIDEKLKVREGKRWGIDIGDSDVDNAYANMGSRMHRTADQLTQDLAKSGINSGTLKSRIRAELIWQQLIRGRYSGSLQISEKEVDVALQGKGIDEKEIAVTEYTLRPILLIVPPGSAGAVLDGRRKEAEALRGRFKSCEEGLHMARTMRDVTVRDQVIRNSADLPPELRKVLDAVPVGQLTAPELTRLGIELFAICAKQDSKVDNPIKKKTRDETFNQRFEQQSKQYLQRLRKEAMIDRRQ